MNKVLETIARENFLSSGYITHPRRERRIRWTFTSLPKRSFVSPNTVSEALKRREQAQIKAKIKPSFLERWIHVFSKR